MSSTGGSDSRTSAGLLERLRHLPADAAAWEEFVRLYRPKIHDWCIEWGMQGADADDVAQEVLSGLITTMRAFRYDSSKSFRGWLRTATHHTWISLNAKRRRGHGELRGDEPRFVVCRAAGVPLERGHDPGGSCLVQRDAAHVPGRERVPGPVRQ